MNNFEKVYPNKSFILINIFSVSTMMYFFGLTWTEISIALGIDIAALFLMHPPEKKFFFFCFPQLKTLNELDPIENSVQSVQEQRSFFILASKLPLIRCNYTFLFNLIKVAPVGIYIATKAHNDLGPWKNLVLFYFVDGFVLFYFYGLLFIQLHMMTSDFMKKLLGNPSWKENYAHLYLGESTDQFSRIQNNVLLCMLVNLLLIVLSSKTFKSDVSDVALIFAFCSAVLGLIVIQYQFQAIFKKALEGMFSQFKDNLEHQSIELVPLHTSPLLAGFEYSFNQLGTKLKDREEEIAHWLKFESEQYHLRTLGEITALVAHDIKTPLHVMQMSLEMLNNPDISPETRVRYQTILERNLSQTISFTQTLMAYLKGSPEDKQCTFGDVHFHLLDLFRTQFPIAHFLSIDIELSEELKTLQLGVNRLDAMHVFYNLYHNALKTVIHLDGEKRIKLWSEVKGNNALIYIFNSGAVLSIETFRQLIGFERSGLHKGLGLRLTHTMVKHIGGTLDLIPVSEGACLKVTMPVFEDRPSMSYEGPTQLS